LTRSSKSSPKPPPQVKYGLSEQTIYRWRQKYRGFSASEAKRGKALPAENVRLKRLLAEKELEIQALTEIIKKLLITP